MPDGETAFNYIKVVEMEDRTRVLLLNEGLANHSVFNPEQLETGNSWGYFLAGSYFNALPLTPDQVKKFEILGLATGIVGRQHTAIYGDI